MKTYGKELIIDIHDCDTTNFTRKGLDKFFKELCRKIDMQMGERFFWDYEGEPEEYKKAPAHLKGISAVQFIMTSNITIHTLDELRRVYLNVFSCKDFDRSIVETICIKHFGGQITRLTEVERI